MTTGRPVCPHAQWCRVVLVPTLPARTPTAAIRESTNVRDVCVFYVTIGGFQINKNTRLKDWIGDEMSCTCLVDKAVVGDKDLPDDIAQIGVHMHDAVHCSFVMVNNS